MAPIPEKYSNLTASRKRLEKSAVKKIRFKFSGMTDQKAEQEKRSQYNYETFEEIMEELKAQDYDKVGLQGPDGIKDELIEFGSDLKEHGIEPVMIGASSFGACGIANEKAER
ncbi:MAG: hypothetical protein BRC26_00885, partial [Nanohaloarchaea archaeon QH_8_44_6]